MGKLRLGWEALKALPAAGLMEYLYKLGGEKKETKLKGSKDSGWKDALDAAKQTYPAKIYKKIVAAIKAGKGEDMNMGGMAYARKKNMGLKMNAGGSVKSKKSKKKSRGTGAAIKGTKFKGIF